MTGTKLLVEKGRMKLNYHLIPGKLPMAKLQRSYFDKSANGENSTIVFGQFTIVETVFAIVENFRHFPFQLVKLKTTFRQWRKLFDNGENFRQWRK